ncbi:hypothetical protein [Pseudomonas avellanae]|uniref:hypothetical protein n=2 Tax=Pseudomonas avellanae TaxID=46257 RepID=UPI0005CA43C0|nr:hypothetical protein [Pseudomonas avellanae]UQW73463.1 hypothetical protein L2Y01_22380 [Pseudomonas avellanae]
MRKLVLSMTAALFLAGAAAPAAFAESELEKGVRHDNRELDKGVDHDAKEVDKGVKHDAAEVDCSGQLIPDTTLRFFSY